MQSKQDLAATDEKTDRPQGILSSAAAGMMRGIASLLGANQKSHRVAPIISAGSAMAILGIVVIYAYSYLDRRTKLGDDYEVLLVVYPVNMGGLWLLGLAALSLGGVLGFLFGIPRVREGQPTNLEQIADWLTKLLVGAGLVQLLPLVQAFNEWLITVSRDLGCRPVAAGSVVVYYWIVGFLMGYLVTRVYLAAELTHAADEIEETATKPGENPESPPPQEVSGDV